MEKKRKFKILKIAGGVLLSIGGISAFSKYIIDSNFIGVLVAGMAFFMGIWLFGEALD